MSLPTNLAAAAAHTAAPPSLVCPPRVGASRGAMPPKKKNQHAARMVKQMALRKGGAVASGVREASLVDTSGDGRVDAREGMATTVFTVESLDLKSTNVGNYKKKGKGKGGTYKRAATTVLAAEATYDVERRVRDARRALGSEPVAFRERTPGAFDLTRGAVTLMPARPRWDYELKSGRLHSRERKAFARWIASVKRRIIEAGAGYAPAFEQNIEVWRQLWRVLERADVAVLVVDARNPMLHLPPALYAHVARRLRKPLVLCLNKIDAVPRAAAEAWAEHLRAALPGVDAVVGFSAKDGGGGAGGQRRTRKRIGVDEAAPTRYSARERLADRRDDGALLLASDDDELGDRSDEGEDGAEASGAARDSAVPKSSRKSSGSSESSDDSDDESLASGDGGDDGARSSSSRRRLRVGHAALLRACRKCAARGKRAARGDDAAEAAAEAAAAAAEDAAEALEAKAACREASRGNGGDGEDVSDDDAEDDEAVVAALRAEAEEAAKAKDGRVMIGLVGHPNVGKSSMVNYILGRKAVSVKATPGHTKTLQTLILDDRTCLCDSPGLVFPRTDISAEEQIVGGLVPLPVVREPYSAVRWLAECRDRCAERWTHLANHRASSNEDRALANALATPLAAALKVPRPKAFDPETLELAGAPRDLLAELDGDGAPPWSPMSLARAYAETRGFARGGNPDTHTAGATILALVLDGRLPYAVPPPEGAPARGVHLGVDGAPVALSGRPENAKDGGGGGGGGGGDSLSEVSEVSDGEDSSDGDAAAAFNPFRALGIDAEGEAQYGTGDIDAAEGEGRFTFRDKTKGAAASYFGRGGEASHLAGKLGGGGSVFMSDADLKESSRGTRKKGGGKKDRR